MLRLCGFKTAEYTGQSVIAKADVGTVNLVFYREFLPSIASLFFCYFIFISLKYFCVFQKEYCLQGGNPPSKQNKPSAGCLHMKGAKKLHIFINNINGFHISAFFRVFLCLCTFLYLIFYELIHKQLQKYWFEWFNFCFSTTFVSMVVSWNVLSLCNLEIKMSKISMKR